MAGVDSSRRGDWASNSSFNFDDQSPVASPVAGQKRGTPLTMDGGDSTDADIKRFKGPLPPCLSETASSAAASCTTAALSPISTCSTSTCEEEIEEVSPFLSPAIDDWLSTFSGWPGEHRNQALQKLIKICDSTQLKNLMEKIQPQFQRDFISLLPRELSLHVLSYMSPRDLLIAAQTCRMWRTLCDDILLWKEKCQQCNISEAVYGNVGKKRTCSLVYNPWKDMYLTKHWIEYNWRHASVQEHPRLKILKGHDDHVVTCLQFSGNRIVSGSDDTTLKIWSAVNGRCLKTLQGHTGGVWCSEFNGHVVVSGSTDRSLRVWNADTGECKYILQGHTSTVRCVAMHNTTVVSGSRDATLRVWDVDSGQCTTVLQGHLAAVRCVQFDGQYVVSGAYDFLVKIWDPTEGTCLHTLQGHTNRVYSLLFDGTHVVSGSLDTSIRVWDVKTGQSIHTLVGHQSLTSAMELKGNILVSGNADSTVKVWDVARGYCLHTLHGPHKHESAVTSLQFTENFVVTSSDDGSVKLWDMKTGEFIRNLVCLDGGGNGGVVWRVKCNEHKLVCAVGSRNGIEDTKLMVLDFECI
ncbi:PREDICTED: F-box/WD repeat-containing protein 7-like [Amphimedon queenslandica]|uniref:F-box domain-containing protein n=1 Tax=Amphimedon queenslandica TaxID=400682 RepID=A0A1X7VSB3_AMPQE|nr:PREDICTED: F-box/WD repeat-containing protein 7-like [Amphimedon queenslandica]|eukprot:XP_003382807.2 PREDICTED: F-box/WD repeat-containing protein 7-like [Amphimedon queenslandica]